MTGRPFIIIILIVVLGWRLLTQYNIQSDVSKNVHESAQTYPELVKLRMLLYEKVSSRVSKILPSPHSDLLLGLTLGFDDIGENRLFNSYLKKTGTLHVVVVSGFNISLVLSFIVRVVGNKYSRKDFVIIYLCLFLYTIVTGFNPPVVRAFVMSLFQGLGKISGRAIPIIQILVASSLIMLIANPLYLTNLSFILSFTATLGLFMFSMYFHMLFEQLKLSKNMLIQDLTASLSAQVLVWPIISYYFGEISLISPLANMFSLWTIPISTILCFLLLTCVFISEQLGSLAGILIFPFLDTFVFLIEVFGRLPFASVVYKLTFLQLAAYYIAVGIILVWLKLKFNKCP